MTRLFRAGIAGLMLAATHGLATAAPAAADDAVETEYGRMILVLDSSGSMAEKASDTTKIEAAKQALNRVVDDLPEEAHVGLRVFGATVFSRDDAGACTDTQLVVEPGTDNRDELRRAVRAYEPYGETPIPAALRQAAKDLGSEGRRSIVLVSDGESTCDPDPCEVAAELTRQGIDLQVDVVGLSVRGEARNQLRCIAESGRGTYYDAEDAQELTRVLTRVSERAANPYAAIGTPVTGGVDAMSATPIGAGDSLDTLGGPGTTTGQRWYRYERTIPGSTVHFTASMAQVGAKLDVFDQIRAQAYAGSVECGRSDDSSSRRYQPMLSAYAAVPGYHDFQDECADAVGYTFAVTRGDGQGNALDIEAPLEIRIIEEPPVVGADALGKTDEAEQPPIDLSAPGKARRGGNSFGDATEIAPGAWRGTLVPGETQIFKVPVGWGQTLSAAAEFPPPNAALAEALGDKTRHTTMWLYSPARGLVSSTAHARNEGMLNSIYDTSPLHGHSYPIAWANRTSFVDTQAASSMAGDHYVVLTLVAAEDEQSSVEVPFVLGVAVRGDERGAPTYEKGVEPIGEQPVISAADDEPGSAEGSESSDAHADAGDAAAAGSASPDGSGDTLELVAAGVAVGAGMLVVLAAALLFRARRRGGAGR